VYSNNSSWEGSGCVLKWNLELESGGARLSPDSCQGQKTTYNKFTFLNIFRWDMAGCNFLFQILGGSMQEQSKKMYSIWNKVCVCHKNKI